MPEKNNNDNVKNKPTLFKMRSRRRQNWVENYIKNRSEIQVGKWRGPGRPGTSNGIRLNREAGILGPPNYSNL